MRTRRTFLLASVLFLISGALGLGYQLIWIRKATLLVGSSQLAYATTVASFFLGLALGSAFVGRYLRSRRRSPLFVYGIFEAIIGVYALTFPWLFELAGITYNALYPAIQDWVPALFVMRFVLLLLLFVVPTFFMGGTLPLLLDGLVARDETVGSSTSLLYGLNIVGAVGGVLATSYFAIPLLGMNGTSQLAGLGNLMIAAVALLAFREMRPIHVGELGEPISSTGYFAVASFLSGFAAIAYQIEWVRHFDLVSMPDVYRTAMILAVYLAALAAGSLALNPILRRGVHPLRVLALTQPLVPILLITCLGLWSLATISYAPEAVAGSFEAAPSWSLLSEWADAAFLAPLARVSLVLFAPVVLIGMGIPALISAAARSSAELRGVSGRLLFWNTLGSSAGGFVAAYALIPILGLQGAIAVTGLISVTIAVWAERERSRHKTTKRRTRIEALWYALPAISLAVLFVFMRREMVRDTLWEQWADRTPSDRIVEIVEGPLNTSFVYDGPRARIIGSNHIFMGMGLHGYPTSQAVQGHLPALFYGKPGYPKRALGIALGTGQTFGALLLYPLEQLDVVDISPEMVELSLRHFADFNHGIGTDERVNIHQDDGRHFVERAPNEFYDVVTLEPPPPTMDGVYSLYSREFFANVERILRDGGVVTQWLPLYMLSPNEARGIIKTQAAVFPHTFVLTAGLGDFIVLSVKGPSPPRYPLEWIRERAEIFEQERLIAGFRVPGARYPIASLEGVLSLLVTGPDDIAAIPGEPYEDDTMGISYPRGDAVLRWRYVSKVGPVTLAALPRTSFETLQRYFVDPITPVDLEEQRVHFISAWTPIPSPAEIAVWERRFEESTNAGNRVDAATRIAEAYDRSLQKTEALEWIERALDVDPSTQIAVARRRVRQIARHAIDVYDTQLRQWLMSLPDSHRRGPLGRTVAGELERHDAWEADHRTYLFGN
jgi:spermidine synthase